MTARGRTTLSEADYRTLAEVRHQIRRFLAARGEAARRAGIDPQQYQLLLTIKGMPEGRTATIGELAEAMLLRHHSVVELIDRMVKKKFVRRRRSTQDRRVVTVMIAPKGEAMLRNMYISNREELTTLSRGLYDSLRAVLNG